MPSTRTTAAKAATTTKAARTTKAATTRRTAAAKDAGAPGATRRRSARRAAAVPSREHVAERAYHLFLAEGGGDSVAHWLRAEQELRAA